MALALNGAGLGLPAAELVERRAVEDESVAFEELTAYRQELLLHCYRLLGSLTDAEDALRETLLAGGPAPGAGAHPR